MWPLATQGTVQSIGDRYGHRLQMSAIRVRQRCVKISDQDWSAVLGPSSDKATAAHARAVVGIQVDCSGLRASVRDRQIGTKRNGAELG